MVCLPQLYMTVILYLSVIYENLSLNCTILNCVEDLHTTLSLTAKLKC